MGSIFMRFPGGKSKALTLSYDDGVAQDIRLIEIMKKHGLKVPLILTAACMHRKEPQIRKARAECPTASVMKFT